MSAVKSILIKLEELAEQKVKLMQQILQISRRFQDAADDLEMLQKLLDARQEYMSKIDCLDEQFNSLKQKVVSQAGVGDWEGLKKLYPQAVETIEDKLKTAGEMARQAYSYSNHAQQTAAAKLKELRQNLRKLQKTKTGIGAYQQKITQHSGYFIDKKK